MAEQTFYEWLRKYSGEEFSDWEPRHLIARNAWNAAAEQAARAAGEDALERAAKVADAASLESCEAVKRSDIGSPMRGRMNGAFDAAVVIARQIRAMKSPPSPVAGGPGGAERSKP